MVLPSAPVPRSVSGMRAVFLDRDGTLIEEKDYLSDPDQVVLVPGACEGVRRLQEVGLAVVLVTNQSGIGRGYFTVEQYAAVHGELERQLSEGGAQLDGVFFCPDAPGHEPSCRKPGPAMYLSAEAELKVRLRRSYFVGDKVSDVLPAQTFGGKGLLVTTGFGQGEVERAPHDVVIVDGFRAAVDLICEWEEAEAPVDPL